jgi:hypothetical protein
MFTGTIPAAYSALGAMMCVAAAAGTATAYCRAGSYCDWGCFLACLQRAGFAGESSARHNPQCPRSADEPFSSGAVAQRACDIALLHLHAVVYAIVRRTVRQSDVHGVAVVVVVAVQELSGTIPASIGQLKLLKQLHLSNNVSGPVSECVALSNGCLCRVGGVAPYGMACPAVLRSAELRVRLLLEQSLLRSET